MSNNETGEFELVLGNRQLLAGFFVVVILFAVFFVMGFIVGRNSAPAPKVAAASDASAATPPASQTRPQPPAGVPSAAPTPPPAVEQAAESAAPQASQTDRQQLTTQPAREPAAKAEKSTEPAPGETYLQVMAVKQEEAQVVVRTLKAKGFPAIMTPGLKGFTRVLVGPYTDTAALGKAKVDLENAGFRPFVKR